MLKIGKINITFQVMNLKSISIILYSISVICTPGEFNNLTSIWDHFTSLCSKNYFDPLASKIILDICTNNWNYFDHFVF